MFPSKGDVLHIPYGSYRPRQRETSYTSKSIKMIRCPTANPQRTYKFGNSNPYLKDRTNRQPTRSLIISKYLFKHLAFFIYFQHSFHHLQVSPNLRIRENGKEDQNQKVQISQRSMVEKRKIMVKNVQHLLFHYKCLVKEKLLLLDKTFDLDRYTTSRS